MWARDLANGDKAIVLFNSGTTSTEVSVTWASLNCSGHYHVRNLWSQTDLGIFSTGFNASAVAPRDVLMLRISVA